MKGQIGRWSRINGQKKREKEMHGEEGKEPKEGKSERSDNLPLSVRLFSSFPSPLVYLCYL